MVKRITALSIFSLVICLFGLWACTIDNDESYSLKVYEYSVSDTELIAGRELRRRTSRSSRTARTTSYSGSGPSGPMTTGTKIAVGIVCLLVGVAVCVLVILDKASDKCCPCCQKLRSKYTNLSYLF